jgi:regulator of protease activity HflC (stomatin/prohibitin superfamily)
VREWVERERVGRERERKRKRWMLTCALQACFAARRPLEAVLIHAISIMRSRIGTVELDSLFHERKKLNQELVDSVSAAASKWGMEVRMLR